jgi:hypothetical protein
MLGLGSGINRLSAAEAAAIAGRIPGFTGLLDESYGASAEAAYSVRRLTNRVSVAMTIRRDSDSTETDIGFDANGNIDEAAITAFCTGTTCRVASWKDQSGNDNHAVQAVASNQPTIYTGGALVKENGKVAVDFDGTDDFLSISSNVLSSETYLIETVATLDSSTQEGILYTFNTGTAGESVQIGFNRYLNNEVLYRDDYGGNERKSGTTNNTRLLYSVEQNILRLDGNAQTGTAVGRLTNNNEIGNTSFPFLGNAQELLFWNGSKLTSDRTSIESNVGGYFTQNTPLLDTYTGAAACYSLRLMRTAYTGALIRVRRSSDNTELDINANVFGELDTVSLLDFAGTGDAFVKVWYDQASTNDATQTTTANQPKIVSSGAVIVENGKPAIQFDGSNDQLVPPQFLDSVASNPKKYITSVFAKGAATNVRQPYDFQYNPSSWENIASLTIQGSTNEVVVKDYNSADSPTSQSSSAVMTQTQNLISHSYDLTAGARVHNGYLNGTLMTGTATGYASGSSNKISNSYSFIFNFDGKMQEIVAWNSDQSSNRTGIENNLNTFYSIY